MNHNNTDTQRQRSASNIILLTIETLTGTTFDVYIHKMAKIIQLKEKIEDLQGILVEHQHLVWQSIELQDNTTLDEYKIQYGTTIRLIAGMRGGPINFRRVPVNNPPPMALFFGNDPDRPDKHPVAVFIIHEGNLIHFFQLTDSDMSLESLSDWDMLTGEEEEEVLAYEKQQEEENERTRQKMTTLRKNMEKMADDREKAKASLPKPQPPVSYASVNRQKRKSIDKSEQSTARLQTAEKTKTDNLLPRNSINKPKTGNESFHKKDSSLHTISRPKTDSSDKLKYIDSSKRMLLKKSSKSPNLLSPNFGSSEEIMVVASSPGPLIPSILKLNSNSKEKMPNAKSGTSKKRLSGGQNSVTDSINSIDQPLSSVIIHPQRVPAVPTLDKTSTTRRYPPEQLTTKSLDAGVNASLFPTSFSPPDTTEKSVYRKSFSSTRCQICSKKLRISTSYQCKCNQMFCAEHRYPELHSCSIDFKREGRKQLKEANPEVKASKLPKI